jgi:hypothetical protein
MPGDNGLADLLNAVGLANEELVKNSAAAKEIAANQAQASQDAEDAVTRAGKDDVIVARAQGVAQMNAEANTQKRAAQLGVNPDASGDIVAKLSESWQRSAANADDKAAKLEHDLSISFFDHPIDYIAAQINMDKTVAQADAAKAHRDSDFQALSQVHQATQLAAATNAALKSTVTAATLEASLDKVAAEVDAKRASLRLQNGGIQIQGLRDLNSMTLNQVNNISTAFSAKNQAEQMDISRKHLKLAEQSADLQMKEFQQKMEDKKVAKEDMKNVADFVRSGAAAAGIQLPDSDSKIITMINMKNDGYMDWFKSGVRSNSAGRPIISDNAGEAIKVVAESGAPLRPEQSTLKTFMQNIWTKAGSTEGGRTGQYDNTKKDQVTAAAGKFAVVEATKMQNNIDPKDGSNIYAAPPLQSVTALPAIKNSPWYSKVLAPHMATGELKEFNSDQLLGLTTAQIKAGNITFKDAVEGLQGMHSGAAHINNTTKNFSGFGLPLQNSFKLMLSPTPGFQNPRTYDMSTAQGVSSILMARMNAEQRAIIYSNFPTQ